MPKRAAQSLSAALLENREFAMRNSHVLIGKAVVVTPNKGKLHPEDEEFIAKSARNIISGKKLRYELEVNHGKDGKAVATVAFQKPFRRLGVIK